MYYLARKDGGHCWRNWTSDALCQPANGGAKRSSESAPSWTAQLNASVFTAPMSIQTPLTAEFFKLLPNMHSAPMM